MGLPKVRFEHIFILIIFSALLWAGLANLWDYRLSHEYPYSYLAGDSFQHWVRADGIKEAKNYRYRVDYQSYGYKDIVGDYPPALFHLAIIFSSLSGLETYDAILLLIFLSSILAAFVMYLIIRDFNKNIAIISLPFSVLMFFGASYTAFTWGHWPSLFSQLFLICLVWCFIDITLKKLYILMAVFLSASVMAHTSEAIIGLIFIALYIALAVASAFLRKNGWLLVKSILKTSIIAGILSIIVSSYYLFIFNGTWAKTQAYSFSIVREAGGSPTVQLWAYGIFSFIILAGFVVSLIIMLQKRSHAALISSIFFLVIGYTNYAGFHSRAFQIRYLWPVYLSFFVGIPIYYALKIVINKFAGKKWHLSYSYAIAFLLLAIFLNIGNVAASIPKIPYCQEFSTPGMMDPYHWEAYTWVRDNTPQDAKFLFLYGDQFSQTNYILSLKRVPYKIDENDYFKTLQENQSQRSFVINIYGDNANSFPYWKFPFKLGYYLLETDEHRHGLKKDKCSFDYYIYDKVSRDSNLPAFNIALANIFKGHGMAEVFSNQVVSILRNPSRGDNCV